MTGAEHMGRVARLACCICVRLGHLPHGFSEVHHQRAGTGGGRRASDFRTMPLCYEHHRGSSGVHGLGTKAFARTYRVTEAELVEGVWLALGVSRADVDLWEAKKPKRAVLSLLAPKAPRDPRPEKPGGRWPSRKLQGRNSLRVLPRS